MMFLLLLNIALTLLWMMLTQSSSFLNGILGFTVSAFVVTLAARAGGYGPYLSRLFNIARFGVYFLYILVKANFDVAWEIVTPNLHMKPRIIRYDVRGLTQVQVTTLANAITLTPGTLSADIDDAGGYLFIHAMYAEDRQAAIDELNKLRDRLMWLVFGLRDWEGKATA